MDWAWTWELIRPNQGAATPTWHGNPISQFIYLRDQRLSEIWNRWLVKENYKKQEPIRHNIAADLRQDYNRVQAILIYVWLKSPTEGYINRVKFSECQMCGRAKTTCFANVFYGKVNGLSHELKEPFLPALVNGGQHIIRKGVKRLLRALGPNDLNCSDHHAKLKRYGKRGSKRTGDQGNAIRSSGCYS